MTSSTYVLYVISFLSQTKYLALYLSLNSLQATYSLMFVKKFTSYRCLNSFKVQITLDIYEQTFYHGKNDMLTLMKANLMYHIVFLKILSPLSPPFCKQHLKCPEGHIYEFSLYYSIQHFQTPSKIIIKDATELIFYMPVLQYTTDSYIFCHCQGGWGVQGHRHEQTCRQIRVCSSYKAHIKLVAMCPS